MVVTANISLTCTMATQLLPVYLQNYGGYKKIKGILNPFFVSLFCSTIILTRIMH